LRAGRERHHGVSRPARGVEHDRGAAFAGCGRGHAPDGGPRDPVRECRAVQPRKAAQGSDVVAFRQAGVVHELWHPASFHGSSARRAVAVRCA
jgi:hypothetical protein